LGLHPWFTGPLTSIVVSEKANLQNLCMGIFG
jgi:hypothetical protein